MAKVFAHTGSGRPANGNSNHAVVADSTQGSLALTDSSPLLRFRQQISTMAIIMAGGRGSRLAPLTAEIEKPFLPLGLGARLIDPTITAILAIKPTTICIAGNLANNNIAYIRARWSEARILPEGEPRGQVWALIDNMGPIQADPAMNVLLSPADYLHSIALQDVVSTHIANDADLTVVAKQGTFVEAEMHENLRIKDTLIIKRIAAPELEVDNTFSIGIYIFRKEVLLSVLQALRSTNKPNLDIGPDLLPLFIDDHTKRCAVHIIDQKWRDLGTISRYFKGNLDLINDANSIEQLRVPKVDMVGGLVHPTAHVLPSAIIENSVINENCWVGENVFLRRVVLMDNVRIEAGVSLEDAIVGPNTIIPAGLELMIGSSLSGNCACVDEGIICLTKNHTF
jgi:glucose-1-phosphate adenylyltransferase